MSSDSTLVSVVSTMVYDGVVSPSPLFPVSPSPRLPVSPSPMVYPMLATCVWTAGQECYCGVLFAFLLSVSIEAAGQQCYYGVLSLPFFLSLCRGFSYYFYYFYRPMPVPRAVQPLLWIRQFIVSANSSAC